ncbi:MAG TPA: serine hydrolase domain-containing protein [Chloroflexota bacterium]|nr:serine hydrolase domain-containing protein [Chloroflexota bacterium]
MSDGAGLEVPESAAPFEWRSGPPEAQAFSGAALDALVERLAAQGTEAFLVVRRDQIVREWYGPGWSAGRPHYSASLAKALVGGMALTVTLGDRHLGADDRAADFVPAWADDPQRSAITIRQLATHCSGISDAEHDVDPDDPQRGWMAAFWQRDPDPFTVARDRAPLLFPPGTAYQYSNPGMAMLGYGITAARRGQAQPDIRTLLAERVYRPIGLGESEWSIGYRTPYLVDGLTLWATWGGGGFTARAVARLARLMLRRGHWQGQQLLDPQQVAAALTHAGTPVPDRTAHRHAPASGLCWYTNEDGVWPAVPRDAFAGAGAGHQVLVAVPSLDLIVVRLGQRMGEGSEAGYWAVAYERLIEPVLQLL